ncbi:DUF3558 family protein [Actinosynnema sp. CS-041913]|uniref:DUF3558 family protein n=1 Tax=Actinosynnema sp. CS-041913 TaxID=3239917 RepID=UPI003D89C61C
MNRLAAKSARTAVLVALVLTAGCATTTTDATGQPPATPSAPGTSSSTSEVSDAQAELRAETVSDPHELPDDLCTLLDSGEVSTALGIAVMEGQRNQPNRCNWSVEGSVDAQGRPDSGLVAFSAPVIAWLGERAEIGGYPARRKGDHGVCHLTVLLEAATEDRPKPAGLSMIVVVKDSTADQCAATESLARLIVSRLPS